MARQIEELYEAIIRIRGSGTGSCRTGRLLAQGRRKIGKKLGEEAVEVVVEYLKHRHAGVVRESADLLYHLAVLWAHLDVRPEEIWAEMDRRVALLGLAEKLPKVAHAQLVADQGRLLSGRAPKGGLKHAS